MATFNKQDLAKIAQLSALKLEDREVDLFTQQISAILSYVDDLKQLQIPTQTGLQIGNINIFRQDVAEKKDPSALLDLAPVADEHYFAVPKILDEK